MLDKGRKYKRIATILIVLVLAVAGLSGLRFRTVNQYRQEQKQLKQDLLVEDEPEDKSLPDAGRQDENVPQASGKEKTTAHPEKTTSGDSDGQIHASAGPEKTDRETSAGTPSQKAAPSRQDGSSSKIGGGKKSSPPVKRTKSPTAKPTATLAPSGGDGSFICTIEIRCDSLLRHWDTLTDAVKKKVPKDGVILAKTKVRMTASDTAYSILEKVCKAKGIALDAEYGNVFATEYVKGIQHLYEKEAGDTSGWLYRVNRKQPDRGASNYHLQAGDEVEWYYSCMEE